MCENCLRAASKLRQMDKGEISSAKVEEFAKHLKNINEGVRKHMIQMNVQYKAKADVKRRYKEFQVGDEVMVHLRKEHFPIGTYNKLKIKNFRSCKIVKRCDFGNAYEVELSVELNSSPILNILDLIEFYERGDGDEVANINWIILGATSNTKEIE